MLTQQQHPNRTQPQDKGPLASQSARPRVVGRSQGRPSVQGPSACFGRLLPGQAREKLLLSCWISLVLRDSAGSQRLPQGQLTVSSLGGEHCGLLSMEVQVAAPDLAPGFSLGTAKASLSQLCMQDSTWGTRQPSCLYL